MNQYIRIYYPNNDPDNPANVLTRDLFLRQLVNLFGGVTCIPADGVWKDRDGDLIRDKILLLESYSSGISDSQAAEVRDICKDIRHLFKQDCVALVINGTMEFVS